MKRLRTQLHTRPWLVAAVLLAALCLRVLAPQGYMPTVERKGVEVLVCHGAGNAPASVTLELPSEPDDGDAAERCAFADLATPMLATVDPIQLVLSLAFVLALWLTFSSAVPLRAPLRLRPPLRGPPATA